MLKININTNIKHIKHPKTVEIRTSKFYYKFSLLINIKVKVAAIIVKSIIPNDNNQNNLLNFKGSFNDFIKLYYL